MESNGVFGICTRHLRVSLVVDALGVLLGVVLGLLAVKEVEALGLNQLVGLSTSKSSKELLGELVLALYYGRFDIRQYSIVNILQGNLMRMDG